MKYETISDALESMIDCYSNNDALTDCVSAHKEGGKEALEKLLDSVLWRTPENWSFRNDADEVYYKQACQIEQRLVAHHLIYQD